jgi:hypothetical protein
MRIAIICDIYIYIYISWKGRSLTNTITRSSRKWNKSEWWMFTRY